MNRKKYVTELMKRPTKHPTATAGGVTAGHDITVLTFSAVHIKAVLLLEIHVKVYIKLS